MKKKSTLSKDKKAKVLSFLQNHPNALLKKYAKSIAGGADPVFFSKGLTGRTENNTYE
jgi:hypothetical protein